LNQKAFTSVYDVNPLAFIPFFEYIYTVNGTYMRIVFISILLFISSLGDGLAGITDITGLSSKIVELNEQIRQEHYGKVSSVVVLNMKGKPIFEQYYGFNSRNSLNQISSVTKSITSLALGICIDRGLIPSVDEPVAKYFPEYNRQFSEYPAKKNITLKHLLNQTTGLKWDEWFFPYNYASNSLIALLESKANWIDHFFNLPVDTLAGIKFNYNSLSSQVIAEVVSRVSGMPFNQFVVENIFKPLSIDQYRWDEYPNNPFPAWGGISLTTLDMAKIGLLMLNNGRYRNMQIVSVSWINNSITIQSVYNQSTGYGLHWWVEHQTGEPLMYYAAGYGDQYVFVVPEKEIVIAINAQNFSDYQWPKPVIDIARAIATSI